jgi:hypothetical protein
VHDTLSKEKSNRERAKALLIELLDRDGVVRDFEEIAQRGGVSLHALVRARTELGLAAVFGDGKWHPAGWHWYWPDKEPQRPPKKEWYWPRPIHKREIHYPRDGIKTTRDRMNWIAAMMLDGRLSDRDKAVHTRLAMHLNLKTGRCDPPYGLLAEELNICPDNRDSAEKAIYRSVSRGEKVGWLNITRRPGGEMAGQKGGSQSNSYVLKVPTFAEGSTITREGPSNSGIEADKPRDRSGQFDERSGHGCPPNTEPSNTEPFEYSGPERRHRSPSGEPMHARTQNPLSEVPPERQEARKREFDGDADRPEAPIPIEPAGLDDNAIVITLLCYGPMTMAGLVKPIFDSAIY